MTNRQPRTFNHKNAIKSTFHAYITNTSAKIAAQKSLGSALIKATTAGSVTLTPRRPRAIVSAVGLALVFTIWRIVEGKHPDNRHQMRLSAYVLAHRLGQVVEAVVVRHQIAGRKPVPATAVLAADGCSMATHW